jgi:heat shock protein HslJ
MDSIIETQRACHEEIERYEQALAEVLMQNPSVVSHQTKHPTAKHNMTLPPRFVCSLEPG